jgi:hypothetical protein
LASRSSSLPDENEYISRKVIRPPAPSSENVDLLHVAAYSAYSGLRASHSTGRTRHLLSPQAAWCPWKLTTARARRDLGEFFSQVYIAGKPDVHRDDSLMGNELMAGARNT